MLSAAVVMIGTLRAEYKFETCQKQELSEDNAACWKRADQIWKQSLNI